MPGSGDAMRPKLRLGLIGDHIARSRAPDLHRIAGAIAGIDVSYERLVPAEAGLGFDAFVARCRAAGFDGLNITYPYKQQAMAHVTVAEPYLRQIGSTNTLLFRDGGVEGHNTDHTGFIAAYRATFPDAPPGAVAQVGAGGVGRAVAFGLVELGARELRLIEKDMAKAEALAGTLRATFGATTRILVDDDVAACAGADGIVNCTPIGMADFPGTPVPAALLAGTGWGFDAVYTPVETTFKTDAEAAGARFLSGFELFFHQGVLAFEVFSGHRLADPAELRRRLLEATFPASQGQHMFRTETP